MYFMLKLKKPQASTLTNENSAERPTPTPTQKRGEPLHQQTKH